MSRRPFVLSLLVAAVALLSLSEDVLGWHIAGGSSALLFRHQLLLRSRQTGNNRYRQECTSSPTTRLFAGFGGGGGKSKKKKGGSSSSEIKLKPKQQWDRYNSFKGEARFQVAVRVVGGDGGDSNGEWLEVGHVRSENSQHTEAAVARQRALIAEHAKRLFPLKVSAKDRIEWAYRPAAAAGEAGDDAAAEWTVLDKSAGSAAVDGIEKKVGFEGTADPSSGYYCLYNKGRLVKSDNDVQAMSKKLE